MNGKDNLNNHDIINFIQEFTFFGDSSHNPNDCKNHLQIM